MDWSRVVSVIKLDGMAEKGRRGLRINLPKEINTSSSIISINSNQASDPLLPTARGRSPRRTSSTIPLHGLWKPLLSVPLIIALLLWLLFGLKAVASRRAENRIRGSRKLYGFDNEARRTSVLPKDLAGERTWWEMDDLLGHPVLTKHPVPSCKLNIYQKDRYAPLLPQYHYQGQRFYREHTNWTDVAHDLPRSKLKYLIALNLYDSEAVLPALIRVLYTVLSALGPPRFHVSIYENGSKDSTPAQLFLFAKVLDRLGAGYTIYSDPKPAGFAEGTRIAGLAAVRNKVLEPLFEAPQRVYDRVIFLNDVHMCDADLFEILLQHEVQGADMSCGMDYKELHIPEFAPNYPKLFYDVWVARDMLGLPFYEIKYPGGGWSLPSPPMPLSPDRFRLYDLKPVQVFSCWNGVTVLDADLFVSPRHNIRFRNDEGTDRQSECYLVCSDIWRSYSAHLPNGTSQLDGRGAKIQVVPRTSVGYTADDYAAVRQDRNTTGFELEGFARDKQRMDELIEWNAFPPRLINTYDYANWGGMTQRPPF